MADGLFASDPDLVQAQREADDALDHESPLEELFEEQLAAADMVVLNKADLLSEGVMAEVRQTVEAELRAGVRVVQSSHGAIDPAVLLGLEAAAEADLDSRPSHHDDGGEHDHDDFESFTLPLAELPTAESLHERLTSLIEAHGILRIKGFAAVAGKEMRLVTQAVGRRLQHYYDRPWPAGAVRRGQLVVIGEKGLDQAAIRAALQF